MVASIRLIHSLNKFTQNIYSLEIKQYIKFNN